MGITSLLANHMEPQFLYCHSPTNPNSIFCHSPTNPNSIFCHSSTNPNLILCHSPKWKTTKMEDDQNGRRPKWKTTKMEDDQNGRMGVRGGGCEKEIQLLARRLCMLQCCNQSIS